MTMYQYIGAEYTTIDLKGDRQKQKVVNGEIVDIDTKIIWQDRLYIAGFQKVVDTKKKDDNKSDLKIEVSGKPKTK